MFQREPGNVRAIMLRGRWKALESVRWYIQQGNALLATVAVPLAVAKLGSGLAGYLYEAYQLALAQRHA